MNDNVRLSIVAVADRHGVSTQTIYRWIAAGTIPADAIHRTRSRGRKGWRYEIETRGLASVPIRTVRETPSPVDPALCGLCHQWSVVGLRGCTRALLGECDCPKCNGSCTCGSPNA